MNWADQQTAIDISGTSFPRFTNPNGSKGERFWFVKDEFLNNSRILLDEGRVFQNIGAKLVFNRWVCAGPKISKEDIASFVWKLRLFYMTTENMSIYSVCSYMEKNVKNDKVVRFFKHMRESWENGLKRDCMLDSNYYEGSIKSNKELIDALLYSGNFHAQERYKKKYDELLEYFDESLILKHAYFAMHSGYEMTQMSTALKDLREDNMVISLPNHLRHEWDEDCPWKVIR